jgi:hypothetical protein
VNEWLAVNTVDFFNELSLLYGVVAEFCTEANCPVMCAGPKYEYMWADGQAVKKPISVSAPRYVDFLMTWVQNQLDDEKLFPTQIGVPFPADFVDSVRNIFRCGRLEPAFPSRAPCGRAASAAACSRCVPRPYCPLCRDLARAAVAAACSASTRTSTTATSSACPPWGRSAPAADPTRPARRRRASACSAVPRSPRVRRRPHLNTCFKHYMYFVYEFNLIPRKEEVAPLQELIDKLMDLDAQARRTYQSTCARAQRRSPSAVLACFALQ